MQFTDFKDLGRFIKMTPLIEELTELNPSGGIRHRINGKGSNGLTDKDKDALKKGLIELSDGIKDFVKNTISDFKQKEGSLTEEDKDALKKGLIELSDGIVDFVNKI